jgi:hypothetical protein
MICNLVPRATFLALLYYLTLGVLQHANQWRNVISGGPRFKIFEGPPSRSAKGTS